MVPHDHELAVRIRNTIPVSGLAVELQDQVLEAGELVECKRKSVVFEEGSRDAFTYYLVEGALELLSGSESPVQVRAEDDTARRALAQLQPRRYTARVPKGAVVFRIQRAVLDWILTDEQVPESGGGGASVELRTLDEEEDTDWMSRLLSSELFMRLPPDHIQRFFAELEPQAAEAGERIVEQGSPGDYLYIVAEGRCAVLRSTSSGRVQQLAVLREGDAFGEEALVSNLPRNASVDCIDGGLLMRLAKPAFEELVTRPTLKAVAYTEACKRAKKGAVWLDVRFSEEHESGAIDGSLNIPLNLLRLRTPELDPATQYVVYCDTGARSSAGAFLLARQGFDASYLAGGLLHTPLGQSLPQDEPAAGAAATAPADAADDDWAITAADPGAVAPVAEAPQAEPPAAPPPAGAPAPDTDGAVEAAPDAGAVAAEDLASGAARAELETALEQLERERQAREKAVGELRERLRALQLERDDIAGRAGKTAAAARELKRRYDQLQRAAQAERARREELEKAVSAAREEGERRLQMEVARLEAAAQQARQHLETEREAQRGSSEQFAQERERLAARVGELEQRLSGAEQALGESQSAHAASDAAHEDLLRELREQVAARTARAAEAEALRAELQSRVEALEQQASQATRSEEAAEDVREAARAEARRELDAERSAADKARAALEGEREALEARRAALEAEHKAATEALAARETELASRETDLAARAQEQDRRAAELDQREMQLQAMRESGEADIARREQAVTEGQARLAEEQARWTERIDAAVAEERERLRTEGERLNAEMREAEERTQALDAELQEERAQLDAESEALAARLAALESREAEMESRRAETESDLVRRESALARSEAALAELREGWESKLQAAQEKLQQELARRQQQLEQGAREAAQRLAEQRVAGLRREYELKLSEQGALLGDERRRLEDERLRLREALDRGQGTPVVASAPAVPITIEAGDEDPTDWVTVPGHAAGGAKGAAAATERPRPAVAASAQRSPDAERERVLNANQLADIRRKMQAKMAAAKAAASGG